MEQKTLKHQLDSLEIEERRLLKNLRSDINKVLKKKQQQQQQFGAICHRRNYIAGNQDTLMLENSVANSPKLKRKTDRQTGQVDATIPACAANDGNPGQGKLRNSNKPPFNEASQRQTLLRSLSIPALSMTSDTARLAPVNHQDHNASPCQSPRSGSVRLPELKVSASALEKSAKGSKAAPTSPRLTMDRAASPGFQRGRSLSCSHKLDGIADLDVKNFGLNANSPKLIRAQLTTFSKEQSSMHLAALSYRRGKVRSHSDLTASHSQLWIPEDREQSAQWPGTKEGSHVIHLSPDHHVLHRRSMSDLSGARRDFPEELSFECYSRQKSLPTCANKYPTGFSKDTSSKAEGLKTAQLNQADRRDSDSELQESSPRDNLPASESTSPACERRRFNARLSIPSSIPRNPKATDTRRSSTPTVSSPGLQRNAVKSGQPAMKFREISEPIRKSIWFHALSTVVPQGHFATAMVEIQKQRERDAISEENKASSSATLFEELKDCRYLRLPERDTEEDLTS